MKPFWNLVGATRKDIAKWAVALAAIAGLPLVAAAQDTATPAKAAVAPSNLGTIEVLGSRIKRVDVEGPSPVTVISREQISHFGYQTLTDVLNNLSQNSGGTFGANQEFGFAAGVQTINLRGFGGNRTLILIDGRRLPVYPVGFNGTDNVTDVSVIPAAQIERIEVLTDGASALYGSDAIGGVVNVITRKNINDTDVLLRVGGTQHGGNAMQSADLVTGWILPQGAIGLAASYNKTKALHFPQRDYSSSDFNFGHNGSSFGNNFVTTDGRVIADPNCGTAASPIGTAGVLRDRCRFDRSKFREWSPDSDRGAVAITIDRDFGVVQAYSRFSAFESHQRFQLEPFPYSGGESGSVTNSPIIPDSEFPGGVRDGTIPANNPGNPTFGTAQPSDGSWNRRTIEFGPRGSLNQNITYLALVGVKGNFGSGFDWDFGVSHSQQSVRNEKLGEFLSSVLDFHILNDNLNLFNPIPANVVSLASFRATENAISKSDQVDGTIRGPVGFSLPGGAVQFAGHAEYQKEQFSDAFDPVGANADAGDGTNSGAGNRNRIAFAAEVDLPIVSSLDVQLQGRYDHYNDNSGGLFTPRVAVAYRPIQQLLLRASAGRTFRAPDLQRLFGGTAAGFETVDDTVLCQAQGGTLNDGVPAHTACNNQIQSVPALAGSNPKLTPEKGYNLSVGTVAQILPGLSLSVDVFSVRLNDIVSNLTAQQIINNCANLGDNCNQIIRTAGGTLSQPGDPTSGDPSALIIETAQNEATQVVHGMDTSLENVWKSPVGQIKAGAQWTWLMSLKTKSDAGSDYVQNMGFASFPRHRANAHIDWLSSIGIGTTLRVDYVSPIPQFNISTFATDDQYIPSFTTVDLHVRWEGGKFGIVTLGVDNLLDRDFPIDWSYTGNNYANQFTTSGPELPYANAYGRQAFLSYEIKFQ